MAGAVRDPAGDLTPAVPDEIGTLSFFQLVSLMERTASDAPPVGAASGAARERVRFRAFPSLSFPPADIAGLRWTLTEEERSRLEIVVTFLGLYGPSSPLPPHYTEEIMFGDPDRNAQRDFLDLFNHRLIALFYRAWAKYRYHIQYQPSGDGISRKLMALGGVEQNGPPVPGAIDWRRLMPYLGILGLNCRSPRVMGRLIGHYFAVPVRIEEAVERRIMLDPAQQHRTGWRCGTLGGDWILGESMLDVSGKFRVVVGPLAPADFTAFLPGAARHRLLFALIRALMRDQLEFEVVLVPGDGSVPAWSLDDGASAPLGWSMWLGDANAASDGVPLAPPQ
jgi:type VI secretion system protein ImpH